MAHSQFKDSQFKQSPFQPSGFKQGLEYFLRGWHLISVPVYAVLW
jgi:hypothetical protein